MARTSVVPDALFAALARPPAAARRWLAPPHAQATRTSEHRRTQDTAHRYTCRPWPDDTHTSHESIQARDHAVTAINPATNKG
eukprot:3779173-Prymnesium_polylepis.1